MKTLKQYIKESILDDEEELEDLKENIKDIISQFLKDHYRGNFQYKISGEPNKDGKYIVDCEGYMRFFEFKLPNLVNEYFVFGEVTGDFECYNCSSLTSLKGAPEKVGGDFNCNNCKSLKSLEGAPKKVGGDFECYNCSSLTSLKGAPEKVGKTFICYSCKSLTSLKGAPKIVDGSFHCSRCKKQFTKEDVLKVSKVKDKIIV